MLLITVSSPLQGQVDMILLPIYCCLGLARATYEKCRSDRFLGHIHYINSSLYVYTDTHYSAELTCHILDKTCKVSMVEKYYQVDPVEMVSNKYC